MKRCVLGQVVFIFFVTCVALMSGCVDSADRGGSAEAENPAVAQAIEKYLADDFGMPGYETSWYRSITGVSVRGSTVEVKTNLSSKNEKAGNICGAVSGFLFSNQNRSYRLNNVQVLGQSGQILINRRGISERCD